MRKRGKRHSDFSEYGWPLDCWQSELHAARDGHAAEVGRRVRGELKRIENAIINARLMPTDD